MNPTLEKNMNTKLTALALIATSALTFAPKPAMAGNKELAVVGGLIGGIIIASAINDHCDDNRATVVYGNGNNCDTGYWNNVSVNVWVPGCWVIERRSHGSDYRRYVGGHYEVRSNRVWVASNRHDYRHDRRDYRDERRDYRDDRRDDHNHR